MDFIPSPKVLTLDANDENIILEIPDDVDPNQQLEQDTGTKKEKVIQSTLFINRVFFLAYFLKYQQNFSYRFSFRFN